MAAVKLPPIQITILGATSRQLNGTGSVSSADQIQFSNLMNGGHLDCTFRVPYSEITAGGTGTYKLGARVTLKIAPGAPDAGVTLFTGYLLSVTRSADAVFANLEAVGFQQLLRDTEDPLLWETDHMGDWQSTDDDPFGAAFRNADALDESVHKSRLQFNVSKGASVNAGDVSRVAWWFADHNVTRITGKMRKNSPASSASWNLRIRRYTGPTAPGSLQSVYSFDTEIANANNVNSFAVVVGTPQPMVTFELTRVGASNTSIPDQHKFWFTDVRVFGNAYQEGRTAADSYVASDVVKDLAALLSFSTGKVAITTKNILPLWWQNRPWSDLLDHLSHLQAAANLWKWGIWDVVGIGPEIEFRNFATSNTTWHVSCYGTSANSIANIIPSVQDKYAKVIVTYRLIGSPRLRRSVVGISPNPFAGLDPWMASRRRAYRFHLDDPQRDSTLADSVASDLALSLATEQYSGTVTASYANNGVSDRTAMMIRAGEYLQIDDWPGGARTFPIAQVEAFDDKPAIITIGRQPTRLDRILWQQHRHHRQRGYHGQHV